MSNSTTTNDNNTKMAWLVFLISTAACIGFLIFLPEWFWVTLPFVLTSLVKGFDAM
ncbi:MAG: hypothetical protein AB8F74_13095 [Saprospiraceae bacterium]